MHLLVGGVHAVIREGHADHGHGDPKVADEGLDDRDGPAGTEEHRVTPEPVPAGQRRCPEHRVTPVQQHGARPGTHPDPRRHAPGDGLPDMRADGRRHLPRHLVGDEPDVELGRGSVGDDGPGPRSRVPAHHAGDVQGRVDGGPLVERSVGPAGEGRPPRRSQEIGVARPTPGHGGQFRGRPRPHPTIEAGDGDPAGPVVKSLHHATQRLHGIGRGSSERTGVQIAWTPCHLDFHADRPPQGIGDGGPVRRRDPRVRDDGSVGAKAGGRGAQDRGEGGAPHLLLAVEDTADVDGEPAGSPQPGLQRQDLGDDGPLVVGGAPPKEMVPHPNRLERRGAPIGSRPRRLDVVVAVDQEGGRPGETAPLSDHQGTALHGEYANLIESCLLEPAREPRRAPPHVRSPGGVRADRREPHHRPEIGDQARAVPPRVGESPNGLHGWPGFATRSGPGAFGCF